MNCCYHENEGFYFSYKQLRALSDMLSRNNRLRRLTNLKTSASYDELSKQALNCLAAYMLAQYAEHEGHTIKWSNLPKVAIYRSFAKVYFYFDTPEHTITEMCEPRNIPKSIFDEAIKEKIVTLTDTEFAEFICAGMYSYEERIYKAARKITNLVEFYENKFRMSEEAFEKKIGEILSDLEKLDDVPGVAEMADMNGPMFKLLLKFASQRNQNRWAANFYVTECSVLGHLFETAVFAYAIALELNPKDEENATKMFFMGIYHDVAEAWTTDIPSPVKNIRIPEQNINFRKVTEEYEMEMLERNLYTAVPKFMEKRTREVIFEAEENFSVIPLIKGADYMSAVAECYRQYKGGSLDEYFYEAIKGHLFQMEEKLIQIPPTCQKLMYYYADFAKAALARLPQ